MITTLIIIGAYLLGSIPTAVWIGKAFYNTDIREHGSKNAGATNTLRVLGLKAALPVFIIDILKGFAAVKLALLAPYAPGSDQILNLQILLVVIAILGHIFPIFASFKGGKGVATLAGSVMAIFPIEVGICLFIFFLMIAITKYVSVSSIIAGSSFPVMTIFILKETHLPLIIFSCIIPVMLIITHRKNIKRLIKGEESKTYLFKRKRKC
ncbi:MAG: glycerol-3-phosphate 1-O-acyltransferase PlsY [Rikenellaceae bacterium]